jgi:hypothetical protein
MKKYLIFIGFIVAISSYGQADIELFDQPTSSTVESDGQMFYWRVIGLDTNIYRINGPDIQPFYRNESLLYPRSTSYDLVLGGTTNPLSYKLLVNGTSLFTQGAVFENIIKIGGESAARINYQRDNLVFYDPTAGRVTLSDLLGATSSMSAQNGLSTLGGFVELGGRPLIKNTLINTDAYNFRIGNGSSTYLDISPNILGISATTAASITSPSLTITANTGYLLRSGATNEFYDNYPPYYGLNMPEWAIYWENIKTDTADASIVTYGMMKEYVDSTATVNISVDSLEVNKLVGDTIDFGVAKAKITSVDGGLYIWDKDFHKALYIGTNTIGESTISFLQNDVLVLNPLPSYPSSLISETRGAIYYNSTTNKFYGRNNTTWIELGGGTSSSGGSGQNFAYLPNGAIPFEAGDTLSGTVNMTYKYGTLKYINSTNDTAFYMVNSSTGKLLQLVNLSTGYAVEIANVNGVGTYTSNSGTNSIGAYMHQSGGGKGNFTMVTGGIGNYTETAGSAIGTVLKSQAAATGDILKVVKGTAEALQLKIDSAGKMFLYDTLKCSYITGGYGNRYIPAMFDTLNRNLIMADTAQTVAASFGVHWKNAPSPIEWANDTVNSEFAYFVQRGDSIVKTRGMNEAEFREQVLYAIETLITHNSEQQKQINRLQNLLIGLILLVVLFGLNQLRIEYKLNKK